MKWMERIKAVGNSVQQTGKALAQAAFESGLKNERLRSYFEAAKSKWDNAQSKIEAALDALEESLDAAFRQAEDRVHKSHRQIKRAHSAQKYYALFGLKPGASIEEVKAAWREKMRQCHPDRFAQDPQAEARAQKQAQEYNVAYQELTALLTGQENRSH